MTRSLAFALLVTGCTLNVSSFQRDVRSDAPEPFTRFHADVSRISGTLGGLDVHIHGSDAATSSAVITIGGLLGAGEDGDAVARGVHLEWTADVTDPDARGLDVRYDGPSSETVWSDGLTVELPRTTSVDVGADASTVDVEGIAAPVRVHASSGSIHVADATEVDLSAASGSIDVIASTGVLTADSGSIAFQLDGPVVAHTDSGSIAGSFGGGGELGASSGSLSLDLVGPLDRDLVLSADSGSIHLTVPAGTSMRVETHTGSGSVYLVAGGIEHAGEDFSGTIGGGGFLVSATTSSGSIDIVERGAP